MKKIMLLIIGSIFLVLGIIGIILPVIPQVPFLLVACGCFIRSSPRIRAWFIRTKIYQKYLKNIVEKREMSRMSKWIYCGSFSLSLGVAGYFLREHIWCLVCLGGSWLIYVYYIVFKIKSI